ncbi:hypothetical protein L486_03665 [Kwoniella mangroviensis CBS 10435]|uniref:Uncharacterized protein n=1 Tax=Kwoniella mangroviensis CBS 10435 TaxID=1331196 RepID=A0A1B9IUR1_9TREE|nr:uncharacterized protein I203_02350 [Kwoniella mangroviensis CBS 8507]OCF59164.1 hypothetical protein L486_03665 [Kwoniella mangroviensis CBS 10435]OCF68956.1 hypothetical protein I203_02350 [Kwoniella mangroviensis CBS 8507]
MVRPQNALDEIAGTATLPSIPMDSELRRVDEKKSSRSFKAFEIIQREENKGLMVLPHKSNPLDVQCSIITVEATSEVRFFVAGNAPVLSMCVSIGNPYERHGDWPSSHSLLDSRRYASSIHHILQRFSIL